MREFFLNTSNVQQLHPGHKIILKSWHSAGGYDLQCICVSKLSISQSNLIWINLWQVTREWWQFASLGDHGSHDSFCAPTTTGQGRWRRRRPQWLPTWEVWRVAWRPKHGYLPLALQGRGLPTQKWCKAGWSPRSWNASSWWLHPPPPHQTPAQATYTTTHLTLEFLHCFLEKSLHAVYVLVWHSL